jgi:hypothetical protein
MNAATVAGVISTLMFLASNLPMVVQAIRTRDLTSYSRGYLVLVNAGNAVYTVYVASLPAGPIWLLHLVYTAVSAFMLLAHVWWAPAAAALDQSFGLRPDRSTIVAWSPSRTGFSRAGIRLPVTDDEDVMASWEPALTLSARG